MIPIRLAVIGAGPMGRLHARAISRRAARFGDCVLANVVDRNLASSERLTEEFGGTALDALEACWGEVDGAVVAVPTHLHGEVARPFLERGVDVLVEKPMFSTLSEAREIVRMARTGGRILGVGHVEWFNPRLRDAVHRAGVPRRIEVVRSSPSNRRGLDIDVVQDFMLHDLDWVSRIVRDEIVEIVAWGRAVENEGLDEAEAEISFASGCRTRLRASRVDSGRERKITIEGRHATVEVDLLEEQIDDTPGHTRAREEWSEPLDAEWADFLAACRSRKAPENDGTVGLAALELVERVRRAIKYPGRGSSRDDGPHLRR